MQLSELAEKYVTDHGLRSRQITSNCRRFERITGITEPAKVSSEVLTAFRKACLAMALSNVTTEKTITDVATIVKHVLGSLPVIGKRLKQPRPEPHPVSISDLDAIFRAATSQRLRRWIVLTYWTALRLADSVELYVMLSRPCDVIRLRASKTGISHAWPVPMWLVPWIPRAEGHTGFSTDWFGKILRDELATTCVAASVAIITPQQIRQASITEWSRANATAGAIVHGCGLGVLAHYLDPLSVLESAAPRVRLPSCFGAASGGNSESLLLSNYRRLDPAAQMLIAGTAERLAIG